MNIECAGETLTLCADRAIYWAARRMLLIADTHFGKDEIFRRAGRPIPAAVTGHDLERISALCLQNDVQRLTVLGDFFHGAPTHSRLFQQHFSDWLRAHPHLAIDIVAGNHDRHGVTQLWKDRLRWLQTPDVEAPFALSHHPRDIEGCYTLSGHVHPYIRLRAPTRDRARLPVFWFGGSQAILPAFGSFTGGADIKPQPGDRVFAVAKSTIVAVATQS
jgi:uncharacterized protein